MNDGSADPMPSPARPLRLLLLAAAAAAALLLAAADRAAGYGCASRGR